MIIFAVKYYILMIESTVLGQRVEYPKVYSPAILVAVPRLLNREQYGLNNNQLPFVGFDTWHAYELSFLTENGMPVQSILKIVYPATSPSLVESKSLKLYLNSFNMEHFGKTPSEGLAMVVDMISADLSALLQCKVRVHPFTHFTQQIPFDFTGYMALENEKEMFDVDFSVYTETPKLLQLSGKSGYMSVSTHLLRSNCKITHQPDWGSAFIYINGKELPTKESLLQYLVSIRNENHFHEEICEMIYKRLWDMFSPSELAVSCIYTRRGGIDICPSRASHASLLPRALTDPAQLTRKLLRQ